MTIHDYRVPSRSIEDLEHLALNYRKQWQVCSSQPLDVFSLMIDKVPYPLRDIGLEVITKASIALKDKEACAFPKLKRIFISKSLAAKLKFRQGDASVVALHELGHILLHPGAEKAWITTGNISPAYIEQECSAEWQATTFALCLMAPMSLASDCEDSLALAKKFGLSNQHAAHRFATIQMRRPRKVPLIYQKVRDELQRKSSRRYLDEPCSDCGDRMLIGTNNKYWCDSCKKYGDKFQDGDLLGFEF